MSVGSADFDPTDYDLPASSDYDAPDWLTAFVRDEIRPFLDLHRQDALDALARWRASLAEQDTFLRQLAALDEGQTTHVSGSASPRPRAYNGPPLDLPLPPLRNRNWTCDQCFIALLAVHDETRDPKDRIVSTENGIYADVCRRVQELTEEHLPDLRAMLRTASACLPLTAPGPGALSAPSTPPTVEEPSPQEMLGQGQQQGDEPHPDGPEGGRWVWWKNKRYDVPKGTVYRMIEYMWNRDSADYNDLIGPVFDDSVEPQTIRSCANKVKKALLRAGVPWRLKTDSVTRFITKTTEK
jgi:hypothetical protein